GNAINRQLAGYVHAFAHSIGALYHIPHGKAIAHCLIPIVRFQKPLCLDALSGLAVWCGLAGESDDPETAADRLISALKKLLDACGLEKGCAALAEEDYGRLVRMIDSDSVNYSPPATFRDDEIRTLLEEIRKGE
ncbi:MAG: iron-containing alcohol dehydrogenase, partial [Clostridia bacterium]|nr:iron-containing alcohol dehydrogenase [Clostridia bacterium]